MANSDQPFSSITAPEALISTINPQFLGKSPAKYPYKDVMIELDYILGRLVSALEETGQLENTIIFITSDNGPKWSSGQIAALAPLEVRKDRPGKVECECRYILLERHDLARRISDGLFDLADLFNTSLA